MVPTPSEPSAPLEAAQGDRMIDGKLTDKELEGLAVVAGLVRRPDGGLYVPAWKVMVMVRELQEVRAQNHCPHCNYLQLGGACDHTEDCPDAPDPKEMTC